MSIDVFGRALVRAKEVQKGRPGIGFVLTKEGDFGIEKHRLCNVAPAIESPDAVNLDNLKIIEGKIKKLTDALIFLEAKLVGTVNDLIRQISQNEQDIISPEIFGIFQ